MHKYEVKLSLLYKELYLQNKNNKTWILNTVQDHEK